MKRIIIILFCFLFIASVCFAQKDYPISKSSLDQLYQLGISFNIYVNDLNELSSNISFSTKQLQESFEDLQRWTSQTLIWLFTINDMLSIEQSHGQEGQFNLKAIKTFSLISLI